MQKSPATNTADDDHNDALAPLNSYHLEAPTVRLGNFMRHSDSSGRLSLVGCLVGEFKLSETKCKNMFGHDSLSIDLIAKK